MNMRRVCSGLLASLMLLGMISSAGAEWQEEIKFRKVVRRTWVDETGKTAVAPEGYAFVTLSYSGNTVTEKYYDAAGEPVQVQGGYYSRALTYGNKHRLEETVYLDRNGDRVDCAEGYARVKVSYMSGGGVTSASYYDHNNNLVMVPALGYAQVKNDYRGNTLTKTTYLDENRNPVDVPAGYAVMIQSVNKSNKVTGIRFEHADGSPAACQEGWASLTRELDRKNREISVKYYDLSGALTDPGLGYAMQTRTWESDTVCVIRRFDAQEQQIPMGNGYAALRQETNKKGLVIKETFLGEDGSPKENAEGIASRVYDYDGNGQLTETRYYTAGGTPVSKAP